MSTSCSLARMGRLRWQRKETFASGVMGNSQGAINLRVVNDGWTRSLRSSKRSIRRNLPYKRMRKRMEERGFSLKTFTSGDLDFFVRGKQRGRKPESELDSQDQ